MKTKSELISWLKEVENYGNSVYVVCNGGGISIIEPEDIDLFIANISDEEEYGDIEVLKKGSEYEDFADIMSAEEYKWTECFIRVKHNTGYNQENADYQIQYYEL